MHQKPDHGEESYRGLGRLTGRVALITGGDSGIGKAVAIAFAREGADVLLSYLPEEEQDASDTANWIEKAGPKRSNFQATCKRKRTASVLLTRHFKTSENWICLSM